MIILASVFFNQAKFANFTIVDYATVLRISGSQNIAPVLLSIGYNYLL